MIEKIDHVYTSYFYQIRFFTENMIPMSTAVWDPKWFHGNRGKDFVFRDKNNVWNGLRIEPLVYKNYGDSVDDCKGKDVCQYDYTSCGYMKRYSEQLNSINIDWFMSNLVTAMNKLYQDKDDVVPVFIVHEAPTNNCSERIPIQNYFNSHGVMCTELDYPIRK